jgi:hypothetical protein
MTFTLEQLDLTKIKSIYLLRGYKDGEDDHYCTVMILAGDEDHDYEIKLFLSSQVLSIKDGKELFRYLKGQGMKLHADVLESDFERFYLARSFKRITI